MNLENIIRIRNDKEISQKEIINYLKVSKGTYSAWESGKDIIPLTRLNDICNYLNISIDYALNLTNNLNYKDEKKELDKITISKRLKEIRKENKHTLQQLANKLNTSASVLSRYENTKTIILTPFLLAYNKIYNVSIDYLLGKTDYPKYLK